MSEESSADGAWSLESTSSLSVWVLFLALSVAFDTVATIYLKVAGDRIDGSGFLVSALVGVAIVAPSIVFMAYALKVGPSFVATIGVWTVSVAGANTLAGVLLFKDPFTLRLGLGMAAVVLAVLLLRPE